LAMKKLIAFVVVAIIAVVLITGLAIDNIARLGIQVAATKVLGVTTTVRKVRLGLFTSKSSVLELQVANPAGYTDPLFVSLGNISMGAKFSQLIGDPITIDNITITDLSLTLEKDASGTLNADRISNNIPSSNAAKPETAPADKHPQPAGASHEVLVKEVVIQRVHVRLRNLVAGKDGIVDVQIPDITLKNVSSKGSVDVLTSQISGVVLSSLLQATLSANIEGLSSAVTEGLKDSLKQCVSDLPAGLQAPIEAIRAGLGTVLDKSGSEIKESVGSALNDLFGGDKKPSGK